MGAATSLSRRGIFIRIRGGVAGYAGYPLSALQISVNERLGLSKQKRVNLFERYRATIYYKKSQYHESIRDLEKAITLDPKDNKAFYNRGNAYFAIHLFQNAIKDYRRCISLDKQREYYRLKLAVTMMKMSNNQYIDYLEDLREFVKLTPSTDWPRIITKYFLDMDGLNEENIIIQAQQNKDPKGRIERLCETYYYLGEHRYFNGNINGALEFFNKSLETNQVHYTEYHNSKAMLALIRREKEK